MTALVRLDLHVHSVESPDSRLPLDRIVDQLAYVGLQGFALTDHNTVRGHAALAELARVHPEYIFIPGVEVSTADGHLLAYGVSEAPPVRRPLPETLAWVRDHRGVAVLAHPFRFAHGAGRRWAQTAPVAALEVANGHNSTIANARAELAAAQRGVTGTGGSDAHELRDLGRAFTRFPDDVSTVEAALAALRGGRVQPEGSSLGAFAQMRLGVRTGLLRAFRGFRSI